MRAFAYPKESALKENTHKTTSSTNLITEAKTREEVEKRRIFRGVVSHGGNHMRSHDQREEGG